MSCVNDLQEGILNSLFGFENKLKNPAEEPQKVYKQQKQKT